MIKQKKLKIHTPRWLAIALLVLGILFLLGATTGQLDMFIIGTALAALAIFGLVGNKKPIIAQPHDKNMATAVNRPVTQYPAIQKPKKKGWHATWWGILIIILVFIPIGLVIFMMAFAAESANETYKQDNTPERVAERAKQETQKKEKERQDTIDKYAPVYCNNQQNISINEPALASEGWPTPNGNGISDDECKTLIAKLYDYLNGYTRIGSRIEDIANRKMWVGMEKIELVYSQGSPRDTNRTTTANGTREQWVYGSPLYGTGGYAYIENDVVTSIQN